MPNLPRGAICEPSADCLGVCACDRTPRGIVRVMQNRNKGNEVKVSLRPQMFMVRAKEIA
jgi:hypothetical protein